MSRAILSAGPAEGNSKLNDVPRTSVNITPLNDGHVCFSGFGRASRVSSVSSDWRHVAEILAASWQDMTLTHAPSRLIRCRDSATSLWLISRSYRVTHSARVHGCAVFEMQTHSRERTNERTSAYVTKHQAAGFVASDEREGEIDRFIKPCGVKSFQAYK